MTRASSIAQHVTWSRKEGWRCWVEDKGSKPPEMPPEVIWNGMSQNEKRRFNAVRHRHHKLFGPIVTGPMQRILDVLHERAWNNCTPRPGARPGVVIDGEATVGKTTLVTYFGREYERNRRSECNSEWDEREEAEWHPVVFHSLDTPATVKNLDLGIANFYGVVVPARATTAWLTDVVVEQAHKGGTTLFIIDDVHYLDWNRESAQEVNDHLKMLANEIPATFVYAGVDCVDKKLLTEGRTKGSRFGQTRRRFTVQKLKHFEINSSKGLLEWRVLLNTFEKNMVLRDAEVGTLASMAEYIYELTGGYLGALSILLRTAAYRAINNGQEKITCELLSDIPLDHAAEEELPSRRGAHRSG